MKSLFGDQLLKKLIEKKKNSPYINQYDIKKIEKNMCDVYFSN